MRDLLADLRFSLRLLARTPGLSATMALTLALGIGASCIIFSLFDAALLRPLPYPGADRLVMVWEDNPPAFRNTYAAPANFLDWRERSQSFEDLAAWLVWSFNLIEDGARPERLEGARVSASLFPVLGVRPVLGRTFLPAEDAPGGGGAVLLGHDFWRRRFGGDRGILGRRLNIGGEPRTVVGVLPPGFRFPGRADVWLPLALSDAERAFREEHFLTVLGRLRPGVSAASADREMKAVAARLAEAHPVSNQGWTVNLVPLREHLTGHLRPVLEVLLGAVGLLLLIPCANVANLLLARATARQKEIAVRSALGATRGRLARQLAAESLLLALLGGGLGLLLAALGLRLLPLLGAETLAPVAEANLDGRVLGFALAVTLLTGLLFGQAPVLQVRGGALYEPLRQGSDKATSGARGKRLRSLLAMGQILLAVVLLIGAGLLVRSLGRLLAVEPGFELDRAIGVRLELSPSAYPEKHRQAAFFERVLEQVHAVPGVDAAGVATSLPLSGFFLLWQFDIEGRPAPPGETRNAGYDAVSPGYFRAMGIPRLAGRTFDARDHARAPGVAVVNRTFAERFWPGQDPIGQRLVLQDDGTGINPHEIVGVVDDIRHTALAEAPRAEIYVSYLQHPWPFMDLVVRGAGGDPRSLGGAVQQAVWRVDPRQVVSVPRTMREVVAAAAAQARFQAAALVLFAALALVLAAVGVYSVTSYMVARRRAEIAIRMALGAQRAGVARLILAQGLALAAAGVGLGVALAFALTRLMSGLLYGVSASDPLTFAGVGLGLLLVALLASFLPARRAARIEPMQAFRSD